MKPASALLVALALLLAACSSGSDEQGGGDGQDLADDVAASVNGTEISVAEVDEAYARAAGQQGASEPAAGSSEDVDPQLQASVLTQLIRSEILRLAAEDSGIEITDEHRAEARERLAESVGGEERLQEALESSNVSDEDLQDVLTDQAIQEQIGKELASEVSDQDVQAAYSEDPQGQYGRKVEVRHILTESREEAEQAIERIESGEDFAAVATEMSKDPGTAQNGGQLGEIAKGTTVPEFDEAAFEAEVGELVGPVETDFGFHVLEVTKEIPPSEFGEVSDEIRQQLETNNAGMAFSEYINTFVQELDIRVNSRYGTWDPRSVSVVPQMPSEAPPALELPSDAELPSDLELPSELQGGSDEGAGGSSEAPQ